MRIDRSLRFLICYVLYLFDTLTIDLYAAATVDDLVSVV